jgi:adenylate cyclase
VAPSTLIAQLTGISRDRFEGRVDGVLLLDDQSRVIVGGGALPVGSSLAGRDLLATLKPPADAFAHEYAAATEFIDESGTPMAGSLRSLPSRRWAIVVRRPQAAVYVALGRARTALLVALASIVAAAIVAGVWLAARITRPIGVLTALAQAYGRRQLELRSTVRTGDELEELGDSMSAMASDIAKGEIEIARRATVEDRLSRFLPNEVARDISEGKGDLTLGGERRDITVVFADVVAFTPFAEGAPPERAVAFLNELFTVLSEVVFRHGGTIDKFIGDSIMAIFGAPRVQDDHVERALAAAEDMHRFVEATAPAFQKKYGFDVRLAIGVSTGVALVGNLGSESRMEYTAIGDVVNVAARLEGLARAGQTLVTGEVAEGAKKSAAGYQFHGLGPQPLRGKKQPVEVLEVA